jgi:hypothetical protein
MTQRMKRLLARVDGLPETARTLGPDTTTKPKQPHARRRAQRADWMAAHLPRDLERLALEDATDVRQDLAAAGLM